MHTGHGRREVLAGVAGLGVAGLAGTGAASAAGAASQDGTGRRAETWARTLGTPGAAGAVSAVAPLDGGVLVAGADGDGTPWVAAVAGDGETAWRAGGEDAVASPYAMDATGSRMLVAGTADADALALTERGLDGSVRWTRTYDVAVEAAPSRQSVVAMGDGGAFLAAAFLGERSGSVLLLRTDADGRERWRRVYGLADRDTQTPLATLETAAGVGPTSVLVLGRLVGEDETAEVLHVGRDAAIDQVGSYESRPPVAAAGDADGVVLARDSVVAAFDEDWDERWRRGSRPLPADVAGPDAVTSVVAGRVVLGWTTPDGALGLQQVDRDEGTLWRATTRFDGDDVVLGGLAPDGKGGTYVALHRDGDAVLARVPSDGTLPGDLGAAGTTSTPTHGGGGTTAGGVTTTATGGTDSGETTASTTTSPADGAGPTAPGATTGTGGGDGDGSGTPGFGVASALAAVLGAGALRRWRGGD
jgi:PGF-CTERM protein